MKFQSNAIFNGTITANSVADAGTNTDKFLVLNSSGVVTYRTALELYNDLGIGSLPAGYTSTLKHAVKAGVALTKGQAVYVTGADGTNMIVGKASNASEATSSKTMGLIESSLSINGQGVVITEGLLAGLDTTGAAAAGDPVWLGVDGNLIYGLLNKPYAPAHLVFIGIVTRRNANNGEIFVKVQNGFELKEIHDVDLITTTPVNGHLLGYNGTLWVNKTIAGWLGYTPVTSARTLTINGTAYDLSADRSWTIVGGVSAFNTRTGSITLLDTDVTGALGYTPVTNARTLTINGTTYDLTANRSWTIDSTTASTRTIQKFTSTANQQTFTVTGGYTVGMVDVFLNGVKIDNATDFSAINGTTVVLTDALAAGQTVEVYKFGSQFIPNNALRVVTPFTATAGQTIFTVNYSVGLIDVFYNGSKLASNEYSAINGTTFTLATPCQVNDIVEVIAYNYSVGAYSGIGGGGTTNYLPKFTGASTIGDSAISDNGTTLSFGRAATFSSSVTASTTNGGTSAIFQNTGVQNANGIELRGGTGATAVNWKIEKDNTVNNTFQITPSTSNGGTTYSAPILSITSNGNINLPLSSGTFQVNGYSFAKYSYFGYSSGYPGVLIGSTGGQSLFFNVDISGNPSGSFSGAGNEYVWRNTGSFITPNAANNGYNTIMAWGSGGFVNFTGGNVSIGTSSDVGRRLYVLGSTSNSSAWNSTFDNSSGGTIIGFRNDGLISTGGTLSYSPYNLSITPGRALYVDSSGTLGYVASVRESKTNINPIGSVEWVKNLNPVSFNYRKKDENNQYTNEFSDDVFYGLIADEVEKIDSNLVFYDVKENGEKELKGVYYEKLTAVLIKAIQELSAKVTALENTNISLQAEVEILKQK